MGIKTTQNFMVISKLLRKMRKFAHNKFIRKKAYTFVFYYSLATGIGK